MLSYMIVKLRDGGYIVSGSDRHESNFDPIRRTPVYAHHSIGVALEYIRGKMEEAEKKDA